MGRGLCRKLPLPRRPAGGSQARPFPARSPRAASPHRPPGCAAGGTRAARGALGRAGRVRILAAGALAPGATTFLLSTRGESGLQERQLQASPRFLIWGGDPHQDPCSENRFCFGIFFLEK